MDMKRLSAALGNEVNLELDEDDFELVLEVVSDPEAARKALAYWKSRVSPRKRRR